MLERIRGVRRACDLDVLLFFYRHPRALLRSEQVVRYVGYDGEQVAKSLDGLIEASLLTRSQTAARAARLYVLRMDAVSGGCLSSFLRIAATREGRLEVLRLLSSDTGQGPGASHRTSLTKVA